MNRNDQVRSRENRSAWRWFSVHIYPALRLSIYSEDFDSFVLARMRRLKQTGAVLVRWPMFFVRFADPDPHMRLRILVPRGMTDDEVLGAMDLGDAPGRSGEDRHHCVPYEPEVERYGGIAGIGIAEAASCASTDAVLGSLEALVQRPRSGKLGAAALLAFVALHTAGSNLSVVRSVAIGMRDSLLRVLRLDPAEYREVFRAALQSQLGTVRAHVHQAATALAQGETLTPLLDRFRQSWMATVNEYRDAGRRGALSTGDATASYDRSVLYRIVPSLVHMTQNRLGISQAEEAFVTHVLVECCPSTVRRPSSGSRIHG